MHPKCHYTATASFEDPTQVGPWQIKIVGYGRSETIVDEPELTKDLSIAYAKNQAKAVARFFCKSSTATPTADWKIWEGKYGYMLAANLIQCLD